MYYCEECQRVFKTAQALAGHHQFKHGVGRAAGAAGAVAQQHAQQHAQQQDELLGTMLERLEELLAPAAQHTHESSCHECHQFAQQVHEQGRVAGIKEIAEIPGVSEAVEFAKDSERWNAEHPNHPAVENWALVEQVKELVEGSRPRLVRILKTEEPLISIIKGEEPSSRSQSVAEIIRQNYEER